MNSGAIEVPGVTNAKREILLTEGGAAHLVTGDQEADGMKIRKWLMITRRTVASSNVDLTFAFVVTAQIPVEAQNIYTDDIVRKSLGSVTLRGAIPSAEILDKMPFKLNELAEFKGVRSILPGRALMLTESDSAAEPPSDSSVLMVSIGTGAPSQVDERAQFSQNLLRNIQGFSNLRLISAEAMRVGGQPGYEIKLDGNSMPDNTEVTIVQWMRFSGGNFIRFVGVAPKTKWNRKLHALSRGARRRRSTLIAANCRCQRRRRGGNLRPALGDRDHGRTQDAFADHITRLHHLHDGARRHRRIGHFVHRLMQVRIEFLAHRLDLADAVLLQRLLQVALGQFHALDQRGDGRLLAVAQFGPDRFKRAAEIVGDAQDVARKSGDPVLARIGDLALGALAQVFHVGQRAQQPVFHLGGFVDQKRGVDIRFRNLGLRSPRHRLGFSLSGAIASGRGVSFIASVRTVCADYGPHIRA